MPHSPYFDALVAANAKLAREYGTLFVGQTAIWPGTAMGDTLSGVPLEQRIELPVFEDTQLGLSTGLALSLGVPVVSLYPRWSFLLCAMNQLVNHLDKLPDYAGVRPRVIVRVGVPSKDFIDPGPQHLGDYTAMVRAMLKNTPMANVLGADTVGMAYDAAAARDGATVIVEHLGKYFDD